ncbi:MAG: hypothetical protein C7B47_09990 [Sulfobacillus thermosulfidooxidans]|uniref:Metalloprotease TldD/E C-terminal domain-containing protein n=1 Tax=Sulfobacillus thermosulfidooxidans TaxID=28034 RepID=A0A2T2WX08_SULTH|nr:MAG: hypothetical protein C7B47_09990 [Sulfobacillus thermosulfidooxidans]
MKTFFDKPANSPTVPWTVEDNGEAVDITEHDWTLQWQTGQIPRLDHGEQHVRQIRLVHDGRLGSAISRSASWPELKEQALQASALGPVSAISFSSFPGDDMTTVVDDSPPDLTVMLQWVQEIRDALAFLPSSTRIHVSVSFSRQKTAREISKGTQSQQIRQYWHANLGIRDVRGTDFVQLSSSTLGKTCPRPVKLIEDIQQRWTWTEKQITLPDGQYPIVFLPAVGMSLLLPVLSRLSGPHLINHSSPWEDSIHEQVLSPDFSLINDPTLSGGPRTSMYDDEGQLACVQPLIENGILRSFVLDQASASELHIPSTAMGYRPAINQLPQPLPASLVVQPGQYSLSDLMNLVPRCLVLGNWIGGRSTNPLRGDIAGNASELYYVEHGEVLGRVKNTVVSINAFSALRDQLIAVGGHPHWVPAGMLQPAPGYLPPLLLDAIAIAGKHTS